MKKGKNHLLRFWHIKLRRLFGRLWLRLSPNIGVTEFLLLSGVTAKWFVFLQIRSRFGNLRLSIPSLVRSENSRRLSTTKRETERVRYQRAVAQITLASIIRSIYKNGKFHFWERTSVSGLHFSLKLKSFRNV
jgi:hypothetical protein